jgi:DNA processing protein
VDDRHHLLALTLLPGLSPARARELQGRGLRDVLLHPGEHEDVLAARGVDEVRSGRLWARHAEIEQRAQKDGVAIVALGESAYPSLLARTCDPPPVLFVRGQLVDEGDAAVAIVGSRACTGNGRELARTLARDLATAGVTIVSGLARGIDTAAHRGALDGRGRTVAVLGCGLDLVYPPENGDLAAAVARTGALVTEFPFGTTPLPHHFPRRNRVIAGWARATLVVEATHKSGALGTARLALDEGREVMAVPGHPSSPTAQGVNQLLKDGAALVRDAADVLAELGLELVPAAAPAVGDDAVMARLERGPASADELAAQCGIETAALLARLTELELRKQVRRLPGSLYVRI